MNNARLLASGLWLLAAALVGYTLRQLPLANLSSSLQTLSATKIALWLLVNVALLLLACTRWSVLCRSVQVTLSPWQLLPLRQAGSVVNFITPGPHFGGEPLLIYWLHRLFKVRFSSAMLALALDRCFELLCNFSVLLLLVLCAFQRGVNVASSTAALLLTLGAVLAALLCVAILLWCRPAWLNQRVKALLTRWQQHPRLQALRQEWQHFDQQLQQVIRQQRRALSTALLCSVGGWLLLLAELLLLLHWLGLSLTALDFALIVLALRLAMLLPTPGGLGSVEAAVVWVFSHLQLPAEAALGFLTLIRLRDAVMLLLGLACLGGLSQRSATAPLR
jgi:glycosyltransferase 2 family protein